MVSSSLSSSSAGGSVLPTRRRNIQGPLHPLHRAPPPNNHPSTSYDTKSSLYNSSASHHSSSSEDYTNSLTNSVFLAPSISRKRDYYSTSSQYSPTLSSSHSTPFLETELDARSMESSTSPHSSFGSRQSIRAAASHSTFAQPTMTNPLRAPQGEFSFQAQAPSMSSIHENASTLSASSSGTETSSMAFARLAQAQRAQQEAQRQSASGQRQDDHVDGPAVKKRRGVASVLVDGALSAAIYTGAAAVTAYSLWSSWGRKAEEEDDKVDTSRGASEGAREKLPPGGLEEAPPPPYIDQRDITLRNTPVASSAKTPLSPMRPSHVYVSSRRRRPAFQTHKSSRSSNNTPKRRTLPDFHSTPTLSQQVHDRNGDDDEEMDEDEMFARMQSKMTSMIEEGNRALNAKVELEEDEPPLRPMMVTPSKSEPLGWSQTAGVNSMKSPTLGLPSTSSRCETAYTSTPTQTQPFHFGLESSQSSVFASPRSTHQITLGRSQNSPYSRIPRLGTPSTPSTKRRL